VTNARPRRRRQLFDAYFFAWQINERVFRRNPSLLRLRLLLRLLRSRRTEEKAEMPRRKNKSRLYLPEDFAEKRNERRQAEQSQPFSSSRADANLSPRRLARAR